MCKNENCSLNKTCYRYTAEPNPYRQTYADFKPIVEKGNTTCVYYYNRK